MSRSGQFGRIPVETSVAAPQFTRRRWQGYPLVIRPSGGDPLATSPARLADRTSVRSVLADEPIRVRNGNAAVLLAGATTGETRDTTYGAFYDELVADPSLEMVC